MNSKKNYLNITGSSAHMRVSFRMLSIPGRIDSETLWAPSDSGWRKLALKTAMHGRFGRLALASEDRVEVIFVLGPRNSSRLPLKSWTLLLRLGPGPSPSLDYANICVP